MSTRKTFAGAFSTRHSEYRSTMATRLVQRGYQTGTAMEAISPRAGGR